MLLETAVRSGAVDPPFTKILLWSDKAAAPANAEFMAGTVMLELESDRSVHGGAVESQEVEMSR